MFKFCTLDSRSSTLITPPLVVSKGGSDINAESNNVLTSSIVTVFLMIVSNKGSAGRGSNRLFVPSNSVVTGTD